MILTLAQIPGWLLSLLTVFFLLVCLAMILIVLVQRPQGGGLSGAFGAGGGSGQTAFGTKTGDVLTLVTIGIFVLFLLTAIGLNYAIRPPAARPATSRVVSPEAQQTERATERQLDEMGIRLEEEPAGEPQTPPQEPPAEGDETP